MKRKYYLLVLLLLMMSLGSCKKYLDTEPTDFLNPRNYYETDAQLMFARASAYNTLTDGRLWRSVGIYLMNWYADEGYMNRFTLTTGPWNYFYSSTETYTNQYWTNLYDGINRVNVVLANVDKNTAIPQAKRDVIRGEMLFLRGYYYFMLVQYFGGVPLKIEPTTSVVDVDIPRASVKEIYVQILKDMEAAEPLVPSITTLGANGSGAVSKSAVRGLLARVNLNMAGEPLKDKTRYAEASKWAKKVIDDTEAGHALAYSFSQIFINLSADKYDTKEVIWEAESRGNGADAYGLETSANGYINGPPSTNLLTGQCTAYLTNTRKFYNVFEPGDNRKWFSIAHFTNDPAPAPSGSKTMTAVPATEALKNSSYPAKFRREYETFLPKGQLTPQNFPLLRYSDILLMYAEAENEISGPSAAIVEYVDQVRRRGWSNGVKTITVTNGGSGYTTAPIVTFSGIPNTTATAIGTATISGGVVTAITLNRDLTGIKFFQEGEYATAPTITITGGGGTGAAATTIVYSKTEGNLTAGQKSSKAVFLATIQDERMRELSYEMLRKSDLLRWGIFLSVNQDVGNQFSNDLPGSVFIKYFTNVTARDLLMPIPVNETSINRAIVQNPGW